jgi:hypothetical protein
VVPAVGSLTAMLVLVAMAEQVEKVVMAEQVVPGLMG